MLQFYKINRGDRMEIRRDIYLNKLISKILKPKR